MPFTVSLAIDGRMREIQLLLVSVFTVSSILDKTIISFTETSDSILSSKLLFIGNPNIYSQLHLPSGYN